VNTNPQGVVTPRGGGGGGGEEEEEEEEGPYENLQIFACRKSIMIQKFHFSKLKYNNDEGTKIILTIYEYYFQ